MQEEKKISFSEREKNLVVVAVLLCVTAAVYFNSLFNLFVYDDTVAIRGNAFISNLKNFPQLFTRVYFVRSYEESYRPLVTFSYMIDSALFKFRPAGYHAINLFWHLGNVLALYWLMRLIFKLRLQAFFIALFFAVHPINTEAVNCLSFREELIFAFFYLMAFVCYKKRKVFLSAFLFMLSLFAKEMGLTFPLLILTYYILFERGRLVKKVVDNTAVSKRETDIAVKCGLRFLDESFCFAFVWYVCVCVFYVAIRFFVLTSPEKKNIFYMGGSLYTSLLTTLGIIKTYILKLLFPFELSLKYSIDPASTILDKNVLFSVSLITAILAVAVHHLRKDRVVSFGIFWFFLTLIPVCNIVPINNPMAERYLYLPAIGYCILLACVLNHVFSKRGAFGRKRRHITVTIFVCYLALFIFYSTVTMTRNFDWKDADTLWFKEALITPNDWGVHLSLGVVYSNNRDYDLALREFKAALWLKRNTKIYYDIGVVYFYKKEFDKAERWWKEVLLRNPQDTRALEGLGGIFVINKKYEEARNIFNRVIEIEPYSYRPYYFLAEVYYRTGEYENAITCLKKVLKLYPAYITTYYCLGKSYRKLWRLKDAKYWYERGLRVEPEDLLLLLSLGRLYMEEGHADLAVEIFKKGLKMEYALAVFHYYLSLAYESLGMQEQSRIEFNKVFEIDPEFCPIEENYCVMDMNGVK